MLYTNDFAVAAQGAAAAAFREGTAIRPARGPVSTAKEMQKTRLAVYGYRYRKGRGYFVSEVRSSTLRTAFLFINCKIK